ncbi:unnamed protein product [Ilex paraguariensis]|uniref:Translation initiation factor 3 N-terminal domain-containing protein n=1 Tax=Ilex paraguariensis TaxID=185542 RepID=A0ABC8TMQ2_9AQUA
MAGLTSTFPFKPLLSKPKPSPSPPLSLSLFDSKLFGLRLPNSNSFTSASPISSASPVSISARYGGGGGGSFRTGPRDYQRSRSDEDPSLDMSTIRSDSVRLIDENQNMVGIVSKSEALQMVEDAELDLVEVIEFLPRSRLLIEAAKGDSNSKIGAVRQENPAPICGVGGVVSGHDVLTLEDKELHGSFLWRKLQKR